MPASASVGGADAGGRFPRVVPGARAPFALPTALAFAGYERSESVALPSCGDLSPSNSCTAIIGTMVEIVLL
jgi:hypothetical protein